MIIADNLQFATVVSVHDGDSIRVAIDSKDENGNPTKTVFSLRLGNLDAPEVYAPGYSTDQPFGREAGDYLRKLVKGKQVAIQKTFKRDTWDRRVSDVLIENPSFPDYGLDVAGLLVDNGWAWAGLGSGNSETLKSLRNRQAEAKAKKVGLWAGENPIRPSVWRRLTLKRKASKWPTSFEKDEVLTLKEFEAKYDN
jgi:endonuclease YncB( thermonuclease family)